jgi:isopropylmalate/homocitrate/citramalate synthase
MSAEKPKVLIHRPKRWTLANPAEPELYREFFPYSEPPRVFFDGQEVALAPAEQMWITDTTFRDGQQSRQPYAPEQILALFDFLHRIGGDTGLIAQSEFFLYSEKDRRAVELCQARGYQFPEVTGWIRASPEDFKLVRSMGLAETGILTSCSDYHIYLKLGMDRKKALERYLAVVRAALEAGVRPRCHLEDLTRADFHGFVLPFAQAVMDLAAESGLPIKLRLCDTLGLGVCYPGAALPRSIPKLVHGLVHLAGVPGALLEWHGHNDFHKVLVNASTAWLYGCAAANATILGFGERTGNPPLEGLIFEHIGLTGSAQGLDLRAITEMADYCRDQLGFHVPANYPFVGSRFNVTSAGIHADGLIKNEEIYNIFDTLKILGRPPGISITDKSGLAGVAAWVNMHLGLAEEQKVSKKHPGVARLFKIIERQYAAGRATSISPEELDRLSRRCLPELFESEIDRLKKRAAELALHLVEAAAEGPEMLSMDPERMEAALQQRVDENAFIQLAFVVDRKGTKVTRFVSRPEDREAFSHFTETDFSDREWFREPLKNGKSHVTGLYTSRVTRQLCITVSDVIEDPRGDILGVLQIDLRFEDLVKAEPGEDEEADL